MGTITPVFADMTITQKQSFICKEIMQYQCKHVYLLFPVYLYSSLALHHYDVSNAIKYFPSLIFVKLA